MLGGGLQVRALVQCSALCCGGGSAVQFSAVPCAVPCIPLCSAGHCSAVYSVLRCIVAEAEQCSTVQRAVECIAVHYTVQCAVQCTTPCSVQCSAVCSVFFACSPEFAVGNFTPTCCEPTFGWWWLLLFADALQFSPRGLLFLPDELLVAGCLLLHGGCCYFLVVAGVF